MIDRFSELLDQLGKVFDLPLEIDRYNSCSVLIPPITIQLQLNSTQDNLFLFSKIVEIPPGKFRENVLREALKANGQSDPRIGVLGYINATNHLAMYQIYPLSILNGDRLAGLFGAFYEMCQAWQEAIQRGQSGPVSAAGRGAPFGMR